VIAVGPDQPAAVHALAAALNSALGNIGTAVRYAPVTGDAGQGPDPDYATGSVIVFALAVAGWAGVGIVAAMSPVEAAVQRRVTMVTLTAGSVADLCRDTAASDPIAAEASRFERVRSALLSARSARPQPPRDDKIVTAWNGLAITALAEAGVALGDRGLLDAAARCASAVVDLHLVDGRLRRASLGTRVGDSVAILEDHAMLATGLLALYQLDGDESWLAHATVTTPLESHVQRAVGRGCHPGRDSRVCSPLHRL
jgi:hypothetical protein